MELDGQVAVVTGGAVRVGKALALARERMTQQVAEFLQDTLQPKGVAVVAEGVHMCAAMRGVKKANARMVTSAMLGSFKTNQSTRNEFLAHIRRADLGD